MVAETLPVLWANASQVFQFWHWKRGCWNTLFTATLNWDGGEQWVYREDSLHFKSKRELLISSSQMAMQIKLRSLWDRIYAAFLRPSNWLLSKNRWTKIKGKALSTSLLPASLTSILSNYRGDEIQELFFFFPFLLIAFWIINNMIKDHVLFCPQSHMDLKHVAFFWWGVGVGARAGRSRLISGLKWWFLGVVYKISLSNSRVLLLAPETILKLKHTL